MATMGNLQFASPIIRAPGFSNRLIWDDSLHVAYRGFAADFCGSVVAEIFGKQGNLLMRGTEMLHCWARANGHALSMEEFSFSDDYPSLNCKGWDVKLVCMWLAFWQHAAAMCSYIDTHMQVQAHLYVAIRVKRNPRPRSHLPLLDPQLLLGSESMHT